MGRGGSGMGESVNAEALRPLMLYVAWLESVEAAAREWYESVAALREPPIRQGSWSDTSDVPLLEAAAERCDEAERQLSLVLQARFEAPS